MRADKVAINSVVVLNPKLSLKLQNSLVTVCCGGYGC